MQLQPASLQFLSVSACLFSLTFLRFTIIYLTLFFFHFFVLFFIVEACTQNMLLPSSLEFFLRNMHDVMIISLNKNATQ